MKKFISNLFIILYAIIAIFVTICLLSYNEYQVTEFGNYSLIIIDSNEIKGDFKKGSLVIVDKDKEPEIGDKAFFYDVMGNKDITLAEVQNKQEYKNSETTYTFEGDYLVSGSNLAGSAKGAVEIPHAGTVLAILESKWGYLFLVVLISLLAFLYEITKAIEDIRESKRLDKEEDEVEEINEEINIDKSKIEEPKVEDEEVEDIEEDISEETTQIEEVKDTAKKATTTKKTTKSNGAKKTSTMAKKSEASKTKKEGSSQEEKPKRTRAPRTVKEDTEE